MLKRFMSVLLSAIMLCSVSVQTYAGMDTAVLYGDATGDGVLSAEDSACVLQKVLNESYTLPIEVNENWLNIVDVNKDNNLTASDAAIILQKVLNSSFVMKAEETTELTTATETTEITEITTDTTITTEVTTETTEITTTGATETTEVTTEISTVETTTEITTNDDGIYNFIVDNSYSVNDSVAKDTVLYSDAYAVVKAGQNLTCNSNDGETSSNVYSSRLQTTSENSNITIDGNSAIYRVALAVEALQDCWISIDYRLNGGKSIYVGEGNMEQGLTSVYSFTATSTSFKTATFKAEAGKTYYLVGAVTNPYIYAVDVTLNKPIIVETTTIETSTEITTRGTTQEQSTETTTNNGKSVVVSNFSELKNALSSDNSIIYIQGEIDCSEQIKLTKSNAAVHLIGLTNNDGTGAILNFETFRDKASGSGESSAGFRVSGSGYTFKNLIIENAPDCGIRIKGSGSGNCYFENCVFRYNNNSGVSITSGGANNVFYYVDSYRNGDIISKCGDDADGFSVKLAAGGGNKFYNCRAWENSDDGWDSYDRGTAIPDIYYEECVTWHNGDPNIFTGEYDYENGFPLDKKLYYVQTILEKYPDFETEYNNKTVTSWPRVTMKLYGSKTRTYEELHSELWGGNPNGFKFGSADTPSSTYRYIKNCIAFDHVGNIHQSEAKGFDQNNGSCHYDLENALSFNNVKNYQMVKMTADSVKGKVIGFDGDVEDELSKGMTLTTVDDATKKALADKVYAYRDAIYDKVYNDIIPGEMICDVFN